jgi:hypothetical protein
MIGRQNEILEICLERLAQGDSIENCLADYPQEAEALWPYLQAAQTFYSLPRQQIKPAADRRIEERLRRAVLRRDHSGALVDQRPFTLEVMMKFLLRLLPRVALGVIAVGLIIFLVAQLPFWRAPEVEPMVSATAIAVSGNESGARAEADLSADPGQVPLYRIFTQPVPDTPEAMLAWAHQFGLPDPALYERPAHDDPALYVIGSDGRRLIFHSAGSMREIFYFNPHASTSGEPLPFAEASQIAVDFLRDHNLLPAAYQVDAQPFEAGNGWQNIVVRTVVEGGVIGELTGYASAPNVTVAADGRVASASLRQLTVETAEPVEVISAQEAYEKLLAGETIGSSRGGMGGANRMGATYMPPANWQVGQTVDIVGQVELLVGVADGNIRATFADATSATFHLTGSRIAELAAETWPESYRLQGVITAQPGPSAWELEVQDWQHVSYNDMSCLVGELVRQDGVAHFRSDGGNEYGLPQVPAEIVDGERLEVCLSLPDEPGADLTWSAIYVPPLVEQIQSAGAMTTVQGVAVEQAVEVAVTRIVSPVVGPEAETAPLPVIPVPVGAVAVTTDSPFSEPENPYNIGDQIEMVGLVQGVRLVDDAGSSRLELQLLNDTEQGEAAYPLSFPLLAPAELMEEMGSFADLHIRVRGEVVAAPEDLLYVSSQGQAIAVESFDRPWPEEKLENFLGHFTVEEIEGQQRMIFTDHATGQRYVVDPQYPAVVHERDARISEEQGLLTAVVHPDAEPIGGLPVMLNRGFATGPEIAQATDASQFPLPTDRLSSINEEFFRGNEIGEEDVIERVELVYPYQPQLAPLGEEGLEGEAQLLEPVWVFYGHNAQSTQFFTFSVRAVR